MSRMNAPIKRSGIRAWASGLAITLTTLVAFFGFWRLAPGPTFVIACIAMVGLFVSFWIAGKSD